MISSIKSIYFENVSPSLVKLSQQKLEHNVEDSYTLSSNAIDTVSISSEAKVEMYKSILNEYGKEFLNFAGKSVLSFEILGRAYADAYNDIKENVVKEEQEAYIKELDKAFNEIINTKSKNMVNSIEKGLNATFFGDEIEQVSLEEYNLDSFITKVFNEAKKYYLENNSDNLQDYLSVKFPKLSSGEFSFDELNLMLEFSDLYNNSMKDINSQANEIFENGYEYYSQLSKKDFDSFLSTVDNIVDEYNRNRWIELRTKFENSTLDSELKDKFINAIDRIEEYSSYMIGKMDQYKQKLESYKELLEQLKKLQLYFEKMMSKASENKKDGNFDLYKMYLNKALEYQKKTTEYQVKISKEESKLKKLENEMKEPKRA